MVHVNLIAGFVGSGKTSVMRHLLTLLPRDERVGVLVNDFGEASIDAKLLAGVEMREISGSCVCCTAPEGFVAAVRDLADRVDRILVEPTGLARPADLVDSLRRAPFADQLSIGPLVVLIDPHLLATRGIPRDLREQAAIADVLVANRTDLANPAELDNFRKWADKAWPGPLRVLETVHGRVPVDILEWPAGARLAVTHDHEHHDHHHDEVFISRTWIWPPDVVFHRARLLAALASANVIRAKGLFRTDEGTCAVQWAGGRLHDEPSDWRRDSRFDAIATGGRSTPLDLLDGELQRSQLGPDEVLGRGMTLEVAILGGRGQSFDRRALAELPDGVPDVGALLPGRSGVAARLRAVLKSAGAPEEGDLVVVARDGFTTTPVPLSELGDAVVVHSLGDEPLPDEQGGPFRLLIPGGSGPCANVKGVVRLAVR